MKFQLIILGLFVVVALGHEHGNDDKKENRVCRRRVYRGRHNPANQITENGLEDKSEVEPAPSDHDESQSRPSGCHSRRGQNHHSHGGGWHKRHGIELSEGVRQHNPEWHAQHGIPMPSEIDGEKKHHKHHRHHHHRHHHRNCTTTEAPATTTPEESISEVLSSTEEN